MEIQTLLEDFLLESKLNNIFNKYTSIPDETKQEYLTQVPEKNTQHLDWLLSQHSKGNIKPEHNIHELLTTFDRNRHNLDKKQLSQYKTVSDLQTALSNHIGKNKSVKDKAKEGTEIIYQSPSMIIKRHHNYESCLKGAILPDTNINKEKTKHGEKSQWCVSAGGENGVKEHAHYTINNILPVYTIDHIQDNSSTQRHMLVTDPFKTQFDTELRNEFNIRPGFKKFEDSSDTLLDDYIKKYPELNKTPLHKFFNTETRLDMQDKYVSKALKEDDNSLLSLIASKEVLKPEHLHDLISHSISHKKTNRYLLTSLSRHPSLNDEHKNRIIQHGVNENDNSLLRTFVLSQKRLNNSQLQNITNHAISVNHKGLIDDILHRKVNFKRTHNISPELYAKLTQV